MENKKQFVEELSDTLSYHTDEIDSLEYVKPGHIYSEEVVVTYKGGYQQTINVSCSSPLGMLYDIARNLLL